MAIVNNSIISLLQFRIEQEEKSSRIYKAMSVWLEFKGFFGAAKLFKKYSDEELKHAEWVYSYLMDLNIMPSVPAQVKPQTEFQTLQQIIALAYDHEIQITQQCKELALRATDANDELTYQLAQKFISEQVEELGKVQYLLDRLETFGTDKIALRMLDEEMGEL